MIAARWHVETPKTNVRFEAKEGFPDGILTVRNGSVTLDDLDMRDGTIEFDMKPLAEDIPGIRFRQDRKGNAEEFYIRSVPDCKAENDCIQYSPVIHGFMLWNVYPEYQTRANVYPLGWNHVRLVISGRRMNVYLNGGLKPAVAVGELLSRSAQGAIALSGPASYANLQVTPGKTDGLAPMPTSDPVRQQRGIVHTWELGALTPLHLERAPFYSERPGSAWKTIHSERFGIVNLNREFTASDTPSALTWVRTSVASDREQNVSVSLGWIGEVWVFVNGVMVTSGQNFYYPETKRRYPDGRLSLDNGSFPIPLRKGHNEVTIAMYASIHDDGRTRTAYGWALAMRYKNPRGLVF